MPPRNCRRGLAVRIVSLSPGRPGAGAASDRIVTFSPGAIWPSTRSTPEPQDGQASPSASTAHPRHRLRARSDHRTRLIKPHSCHLSLSNYPATVAQALPMAQAASSAIRGGTRVLGWGSRGRGDHSVTTQRSSPQYSPSLEPGPDGCPEMRRAAIVRARRPGHPVG